MMNIRTLVGSLLVAATFAAPNGLRAETPVHPWYLGASYGPATLNHEVADFSDGSVANATIDDSDHGWKLVVGRQLSARLAVEVSYVDLNNDVDDDTTFSGTADGSGAVFSSGPVSVDIDEPQATVITLVGALPLTDRVTALLKVGAAAWQANRTVFHQGEAVTDSDSGVDLALGAGLQYRVGSRAGLRLEWERYMSIAGGDIDLAAVGVVLHLGRSSR